MTAAVGALAGTGARAQHAEAAQQHEHDSEATATHVMVAVRKTAAAPSSRALPYTRPPSFRPVTAST